MAQQIDPDQFTTPFMITKTKHRDPYPAILPSNPSNSQKGKIIIITGASGGIGAVRSSFSLQLFFFKAHFLTNYRLQQKSGPKQEQRA
jgi:hypothetical protein